MNNTKRFLTLTALALSAVIAASGSWLLAAGLLLAFEFAIARPLPGCGVNTVGTLATATIVQEALALIYTKRPVLNNISMGFLGSDGSPIAKYGQAVITRTMGIPTVQNFGGTISAKADVDVSVTLNAFKEVGYTFTPQEISGTSRDLVRECADPLATALANAMVDAIAALWTIGNFPTRTGADAVANSSTITKTTLANGWDYDHLLSVRGTLNKSGVPEGGRFYVGNSDVYGSMLTDLRIVAALNNQNNGGAITSGKLPEVAGFSLAEYPACPTTGSLVGFAGTKDSTVYAQRVPTNPETVLPGAPFPGRIGYVTEPKTGLTVMVLEYIGVDLTVTTKLVWMYGVAVGNANNGQLIVSA
jgi:hypothetical protein